MRALGELPGVTVTGSVPDVRPYVRGSALMVAPLAIARGTQNKILEAMAMGVPVVTSRVAAGGVDAERRTHFLVADSAAEHCRGRPARRREPRRARAPGAMPVAHRMLSRITPGQRSMQRLDAIIERCRRQTRLAAPTAETALGSTA